MDFLQINGANRLSGTATIHGAKNSALPILTAALLINGESVIHNCPILSDTDTTLAILHDAGAAVKREGDTVIINAAAVQHYQVSADYMCRLRSSILFLSALSARTGKACLSYPGGCAIGERPIDMHIQGLCELGYRITFEDDSICCDAKEAHSGSITLPYPSVGATENLVMAAVLLDGETTITNAACEPEIMDLCAFLSSAGANIDGAGTPVIHITGVKALHKTEHTVIPDRIAAATMMAATAITGSELVVRSINHTHLKSVYPVFTAAGCRLYLACRELKIVAPQRLKSVSNIITKPYPAFPTDCQALVCAMLTVAKGTSDVTETVFENRFMYAKQLNRFGADVRVNRNKAVIKGVKTLSAADTVCTDLRGGAAVVIAALAAQGVSTVRQINHLDRGYECIEKQFSAVGADIVRKNDEKEGSIKEESATVSTS